VVETGSGSHAERCSCFHAQDAQRALARAGIPEGLLHCELESFETEHHPFLAQARGVAQDFVDRYPLTGRGGLIFHGTVGSGKTHLAIGIVRELVLKRGARALFLDFRALLKTIQDSWNPVSESSEKEVLGRVLDAELLALDDLGAEKPSAWVRETVAYVINERYTRGKPVIITTNLKFARSADPERERAGQGIRSRQGAVGLEVELLEDRIGIPALSRLHEMCIEVPLGGVADYRRMHKGPGERRGWRSIG
jgi:DNA replication protein DnaC